MKESKILKFLYETIPGRIILHPLTFKPITLFAGFLMNRKFSRILIKPFIKSNKIKMNDFKITHFNSFNDFFTRQIKPSARQLTKNYSEFSAPNDGLLSIYTINDNLILPIKNSYYSVNDLVQNKTLANFYNNGLCLVFRLCVNHYHRYHYLDDGQILYNKYISGVFHTVQPIALRNFPVYKENSREVTLFQTKNLGTVTQIEVGAMLVGKISNNHKLGYSFSKFEEKGKFLYGGSTIILFIEKNKVKLNKNIASYINTGKEIEVQLGNKLGNIYKEDKNE